MSSKKQDKEVSVSDMTSCVRWSNALIDYVRFNDSTEIDRLKASGEPKPELVRKWLRQLESGGIRRPRGRPPKIRYSPELIVQLVLQQKLHIEAGWPFSNHAGADNNPCFYRVADHLGCNVSQVRGAWDKVPARRRNEIERGIRHILEEHGKLHPRHRKES